MWMGLRGCLSILITLLISTHAAYAQHGPWVEVPVDTAVQIQEPVVAKQADHSDTPTPLPIQVLESDQETAVAASPASSESQPLGMPRSREQEQSIGDEVATPMMLGKEFVRTIAALGGVLLLIFGLAQFYKRLARTRGGLSGQIGAGGRAPAGLVEVLGRYPISSGMTLVVLRFDRRVLLLSHAGSSRGKRGMGGSGTMQTLCEVDSVEDVASILGKVRDEAGESISASFERALHEAGNATDQEIEKAMYQPAPGMHVQRPRRIAPGFVANDEGDRLELTSHNDSPAASQVLRRRLGAMRRGH